MNGHVKHHAWCYMLQNLHTMNRVGGQQFWRIQFWRVCEITCASKQRLTVAIGEWHQEVYKATNRSRPAGAESEPFIIPLKSANSGAVSSIKLSACSVYNYHSEWAIMHMPYFNSQQYFLICSHTLSMICTSTTLPKLLKWALPLQQLFQQGFPGLLSVYNATVK